MTYSLMRRNANQTFTGAAGDWQFPSWDTVVANPGGFWDAAAPTRFTVPSGVSRVRMEGVPRVENRTVSAQFLARWHKNGSLLFRGSALEGCRQWDSGYAENLRHAISGILPVVPGDYFELGHQTTAALSNVDFFVGGDLCWASIRDMTGIPACTVARQTTLTPLAATFSAGARIPFDEILFDDIGAFDVAQPTRLTVPAGVNRVRLIGGWRPGDGSESGTVLFILKNGTSSWGNARAMVSHNPASLTTVMGLIAKSRAVEVVPGDYFELFGQGLDTDGNAAQVNTTWFSMEVLDNT